ncbi:unnamed protein product [Effrenium voratum]|uniref:RING-type domain-containing protein n=1 Tax=Effrenium voratum TaxID=2562239 RepID=A0AA36J0G0_9DINO|nr:unnamed protein product [Effrenium voratum]CAJ1436891.1 unnamed protein product [Effrenium voratum]
MYPYENYEVFETSSPGIKALSAQMTCRELRDADLAPPLPPAPSRRGADQGRVRGRNKMPKEFQQTTEEVGEAKSHPTRETCGVCLEDLKGTSILGRLPLCGHAVHMACITCWLNVQDEKSKEMQGKQDRENSDSEANDLG